MSELREGDACAAADGSTFPVQRIRLVYQRLRAEGRPGRLVGGFDGEQARGEQRGREVDGCEQWRGCWSCGFSFYFGGFSFFVARTDVLIWFEGL